MGRFKHPVNDKDLRKRLVNGEYQNGNHAMGGTPPGLYLTVSGNSRSWIYRFMLNGRRHDCGLGSLTEVSLAQARDKAEILRAMVKGGNNPVHARRTQQRAAMADQQKRRTFRQCAVEYIESHASGWRNPKHVEQWRSTLECYAYPVLGDLDVASIETAHVVKALQPVWTTRTETAVRLRGRIESILAWATALELRKGVNPAGWRGHLDKLLPKPSKVAEVKHFAALPYSEVGEFMQELTEHSANVAAQCLRFTILTTCRSGESRGATWSEFDLVAKLWTIPASRTKAARMHRVPLSDEAVAIVERMAEHKLGDHVFPGARSNKPLSENAMRALLLRMGRGNVTAHGFRSTFKDWTRESTSYPREVSEAQLAHVIADQTEAAYARGDLLEKRRRLVEEWSAFCSTPSVKDAQVVPIRKRS